MYPTNTPYLMISQGSSGSDQPFMRMLPVVLASFRPEVKKKLTDTGLLMPTIQTLCRSTNKHLKAPQEYLTGEAHPTVFEGSSVDELAMVQKAHALELKALPPMVQLRVVDEDKATNGVDYFDLANTEVLADTPACIARIHRGKALKQRLIVSADASFDVNKAPLTYTWVKARRSRARSRSCRRRTINRSPRSPSPGMTAGLSLARFAAGIESRRYRRFRSQRHLLFRAGLRHRLHARSRSAHLQPDAARFSTSRTAWGRPRSA